MFPYLNENTLLPTLLMTFPESDVKNKKTTRVGDWRITYFAPLLTVVTGVHKAGFILFSVFIKTELVVKNTIITIKD